jgi:hypothetical protein
VRRLSSLNENRGRGLSPTGSVLVTREYAYDLVQTLTALALQ